MPRFFFDFFDGQNWSADDQGLDLDSTEQVYLEAFAGARSMWSELSDGHRDPSKCAFEVRGSDAEPVLRFEFSELLGKRGQPAGKDVPHAALVRALEETDRQAQLAKAGFKSSLDEVNRSLDESFRLIARLGEFRGGAPRSAEESGDRTSNAA